MIINEKFSDIDNIFIGNSKFGYEKGISLITRDEQGGISLQNSFISSFLAHPIFLCLIWLFIKLVVFIMLMFGFNLPLEIKPEPQVKDFSYFLVKPSKPKPIKHNGGTQRKIEVSSGNINKLLSNDKPATQTHIPFSAQKHKGSSLPKVKEPNVFSIPMPKIKPISKDIGFGDSGLPGYMSNGTSNSTIISNGSGSGVGGKGKKRGGGYSLGAGGVEAPKLGKNSDENANLSVVDLGPYVSEIQRRVKRNWIIPKIDMNKKVVLFIRIARDGRVVILNVKNTSSNGDVDNAAINAVKKTAPFNSLPSGFSEKYLDIILSFDSNVSSIKSKY